ncbi:MAG: hypothetical protein IKD81_08795 [Eubacteriaceae bacterium]|nr:hypothetical protein [Eubacteriaceae bacterium]
MRHFFLVDYENVKEKGLEGFFSLKRRDTVYVFYSVNQQKISMEFIQTLRKGFFNPKIEYVYVKAGKQSLDMQLSSFLGYLISENGTFACDYTIVSSDRDFLHVLDFWNDRIGKNVVFEYPTIDRYLKKDTVALLSAPKEDEKKEPASSRRTSSSSKSASSSARARTASRTLPSRQNTRNVSQPHARNSNAAMQNRYRELERAAKEEETSGRPRTSEGERTRAASALPVKVTSEESSPRNRQTEKKTETTSARTAYESGRREQKASGSASAARRTARRDEDVLKETPAEEVPVKAATDAAAEAAADTLETLLPVKQEEAVKEERETGEASAEVPAAEDKKDESEELSPEKADEAAEQVKKGAPKKKASSSKSTSGQKASAAKKEDVQPEAAQSDEAVPSRQAQSEKTMLNNRLQQVLAKAQVDTKIISEITHLVLEHMDEKNFRQVVYREMIKKYRQADGLEYYRIIKNVI